MIRKLVLPALCFVAGIATTFGLSFAKDAVAPAPETSRAPIQAPAITKTLTSIDQSSTCHSLTRLNIRKSDTKE
ncbi:hypothetical protein AAAC13_01405 [Pseudomonas aeruginosa]|uniref:hypothetical protein n=1 Tax=Pseudomonas aeruginosa group TaxID=136841 RepID=UPI0005B4479C|nr:MULTISPECIES: hypothetical protein [Pseudomonas aeruginosa group]EIU1445452.1 hypothetical protein [Pseudomonas aeruginosa]EJH4818756.1 hypothetical protein [Pseudomonas aeruginosa]EKL8566489.1 hypothetical protein [Pseudomonas aeruginosa]EKU4838719.1 hypothetical protein [Pseudomonas aeruginosa]EKV2975677.1 hypothetical protein [Pseudomonas aeruginosa]